MSWGVGLGVRVDVIEELKFLGKFTKNSGGGGGGGGGGGVREGSGGGSGWWGGQGECERRIEVFVKIPKKKKKIFFFLGGGGGGGWGVGVRVDVNEELKFLGNSHKKIFGGGGGGGGGRGG